MRRLLGRPVPKTRAEAVRHRPHLLHLEQPRERAGGPAPLPPGPDSASTDDLTRLAGSEQLAALHARKDDLERRIKEWSALAERAEARTSARRRVTAFCTLAAGLPAAAAAAPEIDAIVQQRTLLAVTDHVGPLVVTLGAALREALAARHAEFAGAIGAACETLAGDATWSKLDETARQQILGRVGLLPPPLLSVATDDDLLRTLDARPLAAWRSESDTVDARTRLALQATAKLIDAGTRPVPRPSACAVVRCRTRRSCGSGWASRKRN